MFTCKKCNQLVTLKKRAHYCKNTRSLHGKMSDTLTVYNSNVSKSSKQSTQAGYMKRFGSKSNKHSPVVSG